MSELTVVVPTVANRVSVLSECLASIRSQPGGQYIHLLVSGNGTGEESQQIAELFEAAYIERPTRMTGVDHHRAFMADVKTDYVWVVGDDDLLAPTAIIKVTDAFAESMFQKQPVQAVIGRARFFAAADLSDLSTPLPEIERWRAGTYSTIDDLALATSGAMHLGAFVFRTELFKDSNYDRYLGTSHEIFGAFWDGITASDHPLTQVLDCPLVLLRQAQKEWDHSRLRTSVGLLTFNSLLPAPIAATRKSTDYRLTRRQALIFASECSATDKSLLNELIGLYPSRAFLSFSLAKTPRVLARLLIRAYRIMRG